MHHSVLKCSNIKEYQHVLHGDALQLFEASIPLMEKPSTWFLHNWNIGWKWVKSTLISFTQFYASVNVNFLLFLIQAIYTLLHLLVASLLCQL